MPIDKPFYRPVRKPKALPPKLTRIIKLSKGVQQTVMKINQITT